MFDTHAHLNFKDYEKDLDEVVRRTLAGKTGMINVGSQYSTSQRAVKIANQYEKKVYASIGLHPIHLGQEKFKEKVDENEIIEFQPRFEKFDKIKYLELGRNKKVVAVGEIGLDYFHNKENKELQKEVFSEQIDLATELDLPIIIHCRDENFDEKKTAHNDLAKILREKKEEFGKKLRGVVHCFSGGMKEAENYVALGFYLGFNGIVTFSKDYDEVLKKVDMANILLETDCPYLTPIPFRGRRNEPLFVRYVAEKIADLKGISLGEVEKITDENAKEVFGVGIE